MPKLSDGATALGVDIDPAADFLPVLDESATGADINKKILIGQLLGLVVLSALIDDTAGTGDTDVVWSADKSTSAIAAAIAALGTGSSLTADTDGTLAANSDTRVATQKAIRTYVDSLQNGRRWKEPVRAATTAAGALATDFENGDTIDGVTLATGDRILIKDQASAAENGVYVVAASGAPTRATDADAGAELVNATVMVSEGTANSDKLFTCSTNAPITPGTTGLAFTQIGTVGGGLLASNNLSDLSNIATAVANLGLTIGTNVQAYNAKLAAIAGLTLAADKLIYWTGASAAASTDLSAFIRTLLDDADATTARATLGAEPQGVFFGVNTQTASYTLVIDDAGKLVEMNVASANNLTVPPNSSVAFPVNTRIDLAQYGAGQTTIMAGSGVTIRSSGGKLKLTGQYSGGTLYKRATDEWVLIGDIAS